MIKVGDRVRIHRPVDENDWPGWMRGMDEDDGVEIVVKKLVEFPGGNVIEHSKWYFNVKWCEKLETQASLSSAIDLKTLNSAPSAVKCAACGGDLKEPYPRIKFCPRCEK